MQNPPYRRIVLLLLSLISFVLYCYALFLLNEIGIIPINGWRLFVFAGLYVLVGTGLGAFLAFINRLL